MNLLAKNQFVTIKGTRDGLTLYLNDTCDVDRLLEELDHMLMSEHFDHEESLVTITVQLGKRYLHTGEREKLESIISKRSHFVIQSIESDVVLKEDAIRWKEESEIRTFSKTIRSGQVIDIVGDVLLIGDINPGGTLKATGNIFVLGHLRGTAHAGHTGDKNAVIMASYMNPMQLRIADFFSRSPDYESDGVYMEGAYVEDSGKIMIDRLHVVAKKRPDLSGFERSVLNG
ncbi:septum site-determining protein MinC [Pelagirhabdus alkalitolerans]|uniref:septum site-determining protein MinC n=1 Tax=Pelagirhabdus alkalitolerans TaxID=1612202 RepID=UPI0031832F8F